MLKIRSRTKAEDVQKAAGFSWPAWQRFHVRCVVYETCSTLLILVKKLTLDSAKAFVSECNGSLASWSAVDNVQAVAMLDKLNHKLSQQRLPTVNEDVFHWRMAQIMPSLIRQQREKEKERDQEHSSSPVPPDSEGERATVWGHDTGHYAKESSPTGHYAKESSPASPGQAMSIETMLNTRGTSG